MTPIQELIHYWTQRRREAHEGGDIKLWKTADLIVQHLTVYLIKEKEFADKCFTAGRVYGACSMIDGNNSEPDKEQFLNQLYPKP